MSVDEIGTDPLLNFSSNKIFTIDGIAVTTNNLENQGVNNHLGGSISPHVGWISPRINQI